MTNYFQCNPLSIQQNLYVSSDFPGMALVGQCLKNYKNCKMGFLNDILTTAKNVENLLEKF